MRNQKVAMNEKRANGLRWKMNEGKFVAVTYVDKRLLESFQVDFELDPLNGKTAVAVKSLYYETLKKEKTSYNDFKTAVNAVNEFFEEIDELIANVPFEAKERAYNAYQREIARGININ